MRKCLWYRGNSKVLLAFPDVTSLRLNPARQSLMIFLLHCAIYFFLTLPCAILPHVGLFGLVLRCWRLACSQRSHQTHLANCACCKCNEDGGPYLANLTCCKCTKDGGLRVHNGRRWWLLMRAGAAQCICWATHMGRRSTAGTSAQCEHMLSSRTSYARQCGMQRSWRCGCCRGGRQLHRSAQGGPAACTGG